MPEFLTVSEVAELLRTSDKSVKQFIEKGDLVASDMAATGVKRRYIVRREDIDAFVEARRFSGSVPKTSNKARGAKKDAIQSQYEKLGFDF